jgi:hypothetical protein
VVKRLTRDEIFGEAEAFKAIVRARWIAAESAGVDIDGVESGIALGDAIRLIDGDEARRAAALRGSGDRVGNGLPGCRARDENRVDLISLDCLGEVFRIDQLNLHLVERNAVMMEDDVE